MTLNGVAGDIEHIWQSRALHLHFEQPTDTVTHIDPSRNEFLATCDLRENPDGSDLPPAMKAKCPTAGHEGKYSKAVHFDGNDDRLMIKDSVGVSATDAITTPVESRLNLHNSSFTVMAWVNADDWSGSRAVLGTDPAQDSEALFIGFVDGKPTLSYGGSTVTSDRTLRTGPWRHVVWRFDMESGEQAIFFDGTLDTTATGRLPYMGLSNSVYVGQADAASTFSGMLDEVAIYPFALDDDTIYDIAIPVQSGLQKVEIRFRKYDASGQLEDTGTWYETTLNSGTTSDIFRTWEFTVPSGLNGSYKIDLRATDSFGLQSTAENAEQAVNAPPPNTRYVPGVWSGMMGYERFKTFFFPVIHINNDPG